MLDKKQKVLDKLEKLAELLDEVHDNNPDTIFHEDWIEVTDTMSKIQRNDEATPETLRRMNFLWRKNQAIKKWKVEHNGEEINYVDIIEWTLKDLILNDKMGKISAIKYARENVIPSSGEKMTLIEAKIFVEKLMEVPHKKASKK